MQCRFNMPTATELDRISYEINGAGIAIHTRLGPGCFETAYTPCFAYELQRRKLQFRARVPLTLRYEEVVVDCAYEADFIVEGCVVVEVKALERVAPIHSRQLQTYLRLTGCPLGLLLNFGAPTMVDGIKRLVNNFPDGTPPHSAVSSPSADVRRVAAIADDVPPAKGKSTPLHDLAQRAQEAEPY
jgi:GxxExxY protein